MLRNLLVAAMAASLAAVSAHAQETPTPPQATADVEQEGMEVLTRGPVHEAFAEPVTLDPNERVAVISEQPPEPIDEIPPDARPEDASAVWIPGYWDWDDVENRYLWVSGVWRVPPSGQRWVPGYWTEGDGGYQRVSGFWTAAAEQQVQYLPEPPETLEVGPNTNPPSADHFWIPGCWIYSDNAYRWRPGYWHATTQNWLWVPDRYVWTPRGHVFCNGYWDYSDWWRRGVLFAPVHFHRPIYRTAGYYFTPRVFIGVNYLSNHFFCRPGFRHYYFGDFYGGPYVNLGFRHCYSWNRWGRGWDPYFNHFRWTHAKRDPHWHDHWRDRYDHYARRDRDRLPHNWKEARDWERRRDGDRREWDRDRFVGGTVDEAVRRRDGRTAQLARMSDEERSRYRENARELRDFSRQRGDVERRVTPDGRRLGQVPDREGARGALRLPDSDQFRRAAMRDEEGRRRTEPGLTREGQRPERLGQRELGQRELERRAGDPRERLQPRTDSGELRGLDRQADERARFRPSEETPRQFDSRRFEDVRRGDRESERSVLERRSVGRAPLESPEGRRTPRTLEGRRFEPQPRELEGRQRLERSPGQPGLEGGRRTLPPPSEFRRGERTVDPGSRFDSRSRGALPSRGEAERSRGFERRSFSPQPQGPSRQQFSRPQGSRSIEAAPRGDRSGGERSFRSGGPSGRGGSPSISRGGGGRGGGEARGGRGGGGGGGGGKGKRGKG